MVDIFSELKNEIITIHLELLNLEISGEITCYLRSSSPLSPHLSTNQSQN